MKMKKIKCFLIKKQFSSLRDQWLYPEEEREVRGHLALCSDCRKAWGQYNQALDWIHQPASIGTVSPNVWGRLQCSLEVEKKNWSVERKYEEEIVPLRWGGALALGMAAMLFLTVMLQSQQEEQDLAAQTFLTQSQYGKVLSVF